MTLIVTYYFRNATEEYSVGDFLLGVNRSNSVVLLARNPKNRKFQNAAHSSDVILFGTVFCSYSRQLSRTPYDRAARDASADLHAAEGAEARGAERLRAEHVAADVPAGHAGGRRHAHAHRGSHHRLRHHRLRNRVRPM